MHTRDETCPLGSVLLRRAVSQTLTVVALLMGIAGAATTAARAQTELGDTTSLGQGPYAVMHTLLEKTIFKVDVLTLEIRFGKQTAERLAELAQGQRLTASLVDSIARTALGANDVFARIRFERNVSLNQFVNGVRDNAAAARDAGIISDAEFDDVSRGLPQWYGFLADTGIKDGDEMFYRIRGDTLQTVYRTAAGEIRLDQTDVGPFRRLSVMGGYFAPKSDFRKGLIASLFARTDGRDVPGTPTRSGPSGSAGPGRTPP